MGVINDSSADVTSLFKFYHTDTSKFYPEASGASEYVDTLFAVTGHTSTTTNQTIIKFVKDSGGTWESTTLIDAVTSAALSITGITPGDLVRFLDKVYYSNYEHDVLQLRPRSSSGDTDENYVFKAGLPDPNAERVINRCDETAEWTKGGSGTSEAGIDKSPLHRLEGSGSLYLTQETDGETTTLTYSITAMESATLNLNTFKDGTTASDSDFIALDIFRFNKDAISEITLDLTSGGWTNYYSCTIISTPTTTLPSGETWNLFHPHQTTFNAKWNVNPLDNQMFNMRIQRAWFRLVGSPTGWSAISTFRVSLKGNSRASGDTPAKICIDNVRLLKTPPVATSYRCQWATFEPQESGSSTGWIKNCAAGTKSTFNSFLAREGVYCLEVSPDTTGTACEALTFDSGKDLATFPDGVTATTSDVLKINLSWKGIAVGNWTAWNLWKCPKFRFYDSANAYRSVNMGVVASLKGGGAELSVRFRPESGVAPWSAAVTAAPDWTDITRIHVFGPSSTDGLAGTIQPYYVDDMRLERPEVMMPVDTFEPLGLYAIDAGSTFLGAVLKDYGELVEMVGEAAKWLWSSLKYQTYGMGHKQYPDYEHSSIGIAGCRLTAYGSKTFGITFHYPAKPIDLTTYKVAEALWPPEWDFPNKWGVVEFVEITAGASDKFEMWIASPDIKTVQDVTIKIHGDVGGALNRDSYYEYTIHGQEMAAKLREQAKQDKETEETMGSITQIFNSDGENRKEDLATLYGTLTNPNQAGEVKEFVSNAIRYLGKDRGGWPSSVFSWKRSDMIAVKHDSAAPDLTSVRGWSIEVTSNGGEATIVVDNLVMIKEGALKGSYHYKLLMEDDEGFLSSSSEPSIVRKVDRKDIVLTKIYTPSEHDLKRVKNKRIYRIGGMSTEWKHVADMAPDATKLVDKVSDEDTGLIMPPDAYAPPKAKVMTSIANCMYYGNVVDRFDNKIPYRMYKSEAFCPFRVSDFSCIDIPEKKGSGITGLADYYNHIVIWTSDSMWTTARGLSTPVKRSSKGNIARRSIVVSDYGIIWLSRDGLMIGDISSVNDRFFAPINSLFEDYTETELSTAVGVMIDKFYYLFYNFSDAGTGDAIVCKLDEGTFSELTGPFDVRSICKWDGSGDYNDVYYGRSSGKIYKMFDGEDDDGTAISTILQTKDFSTPGIQYDKFMRAFYVSTANLGTANATLTPTIYADQSHTATLSVITATSTNVKTYAEKSSQGAVGTHLGVKVDGVGRHKITQMLMKIQPEEDSEYSP